MLSQCAQAVDIALGAGLSLGVIVGLAVAIVVLIVANWRGVDVH